MNAPFNRPTLLTLAGVASTRRVITAAQVRELERIAADATNAGERIEAAEARCLEDLDKTTHAAWQRGYAEGHAQALERLDALLGAIDARRASLETELIELVLGALERIARGLPPELLTPRLIATALDEAQCDRGRLVLRIHPQRADIARNTIEQASSAYATRLVVELDPALATDACILETPVGAVDASLATQLDALRAVMTRRDATLEEQRRVER